MGYEYEFKPRFRHLVVLLFSAVTFALIASFPEFLPDKTETVLFSACILFLAIGIIWIGWLVIERKHSREMEAGNSEHDNLIALARISESFNDLPPAAKLQALHKILPELGFDTIIIPELINNASQIVTNPNEVFEHSTSITPDEKDILRQATLDLDGHFTYRNMTPKYFSDPRWRVLRKELLKKSANDVSYCTEKTKGNDSILLTDAGWQWLELDTPSPTPSGFLPVSPDSRG